jgi:LmbE family N-acetylglucosaminyl deacetylase
MKNNRIYFIFVLLTICFGCSPSRDDLKKFAATESFPADTYLDSVKEKRALIVVAHDDDDCTMSGTISKLHSEGWKILNLSFTSHKAEAGIPSHPSTVICDGHEEILSDEIYRNDTDSTDKKYMPFPKADFDKVFLKDKITKALVKRINEFQPTVIFTLDNEIGGYGHPDHVFLSNLLLDLAKADSIHPKKIYQSVFTRHMEHEIIDVWLDKRLKKWGFNENMYSIGKKVYGVEGMPVPTVEINIKSQAQNKMKYLRTYDESVRHDFRKFIPYYEDYDAEVYFGIFDREFFRVIGSN